MNEEPQSTIVMGHITDIKEKLATNTADTKNIFITLNKIEENLKIHNSLFATKEELGVLIDNDKDKETRLRSIEKNVWKAIGALAVLEVIFPIVLHFLKIF